MRRDANLRSPAQVYSDAVANLDVNARARLATEATCKWTIQNARSRLIPPDPVNLNTFVITNDWAQTIPNTTFLLYDNLDRANNRIVIFAKDEHLQLLATARKWYMDGCFKLAPVHLFVQLYMINIEYGNRPIPLVYDLLREERRRYIRGNASSYIKQNFTAECKVTGASL